MAVGLHFTGWMSFLSSN